MPPERTALVALLAAAAASAGENPFRVLVDHSQAPEMAEYGARAKALCEEWYPKINDFLFGAAHPLPYREIRIVMEKREPRQVKFAGRTGFLMGSASGGVIRIPSQRPDPRRFDTLVVHELTHINTDNYALRLRCDGWRQVPCFFQIRFSHPNRGIDWMQEAVGDYIAYAVFRKNLEPRLRLDHDGYLTGYDDSNPSLHDLEQAKMRIGGQGYRLSYSVAASFLLWLEQTKDKDIVRKLNLALTEHRGSPRLLRRYCGAPLDRLWRDFLAASRRSM